MTELVNKPSMPSNLPVKSKSTYAKQYDDFERRLDKNSYKVRLPTLHLRNKKPSLVDPIGHNYL